MNLNSDKLNTLLPQIEEVRRRKIVDAETDSNVNYIDTSENLSKLRVHNNHLLFGRRGSGKTTLMSAAIKASVDDFSIIYDLQSIRELQDNNIILRILIRILTKVYTFVNEEFKAIEAKYKLNYRGYKGLIAKVTRRRDKDIKDLYEQWQVLSGTIKTTIDVLRKIESSPPEITFKIGTKITRSKMVKESSATSTKIESSLQLKGELKASYDFVSTTLESLTNASFSRSTETVKENHETTDVNFEAENSQTVTKGELIDNVKEVISIVTNEFQQLTNKHIVLYLDDFYQISFKRTTESTSILS